MVDSEPHRMMAVVTAPPAAPTDSALLGRFAEGDRTALEELFRRYRTTAFRVAYRLLGREQDALDAVQDAFIKVLTNLDRFRGQSSFKTWLLRIVSNAALDLGRHRKRDGWNDRDARPAAADHAEIDRRPPPESEMERADLRKVIEAALAKLPPAQRQTFVLHVDGELSYREVAEAMGISIGTVMSRLFYARQKLKELLADRDLS
jgi:RNA polymerase sigma-70 factor (ECF subfamily)